jgi:hypothetical protein
MHDEADVGEMEEVQNAILRYSRLQICATISAPLQFEVFNFLFKNFKDRFYALG